MPRPADRRIILSLVCSALSVALLIPSPLRAQGRTDAERLERLERAVELLQKRNAELEQEVKSLKNAKAPAAPAPLSAEKRSHFVRESKSDVEKTETTEEKKPVYVLPGAAEYKLTLGGYIQANFEAGDVSAFEGRFGSTALNDRFRLRRARLGLSGDYKEQFEFKIEGDFEQSDGLSSSTRTAFSSTDIFINWHAVPEANFKVGQWKAPFGLENLTPDSQILTIERSLPTGAVVPERQIGVMLWGKPLTNIAPEQKDLVTYYAGVFNGTGRNFNINDNDEFMFVGRLELLPFSGELMGQEASLKIGGDYFSSRDAVGTNISPGLNLRVNADGSLSSYVLANPDDRHAYSFDASLKIGPFDLIGEYFNETVSPRGAAPTFSRFEPDGYYVQASYFLIAKKLQAVAKWESLDPGQRPDDAIHSVTGGLNYYIHGDAIKVMANYVHTWSDFREGNPQFGTDQFDEVILRLQVMF